MKHVLVVCLVVFISAFTCGDSYSQWTQTNGPFGGIAYSLATIGENTFASCKSGVFRSSDDGLHWVSVTKDLPSSTFYTPLTILGSTIFIQIDGAIFRSRNLGESWSRIKELGNDVFPFISIGPFLYCNNGGPGLISLDTGVTWTKWNSEFTFPDLTDPSTPFYVQDGTSLYCLTYNRIYESTDTAKTWKSVGIVEINERNALAIHNHHIIIASKYGIYQFKKVDTAFVFDKMLVPYTVISALTSNGNNIIAGTQKGISVSSDNGNQWTDRNEGFNSMNVFALESDGTFLYAGTIAGVYRSSDAGEHWTEANGGLSDNVVYQFYPYGPYLFAVSIDSGLYISTNKGLNWNPNYILSRNNYWRPTSITGIHNRLFVTLTNSATIFSTNNGDSWETLSTTRENEKLYSTNNLLFASNFSLGPLISRDYGETWQQVRQDSVSNYKINTIVGNDEHIYFGTDGGLFRSYSQGQAFAPFDNNLSFFDVRSIFLLDKTIIVGTYQNSIYISRDEGATWKYSSPEMPFGCTIPSLKKFGNYLFAATDGNGIWKHPLNTLSIPSHPAPTAMPMIAYPNPLTNSTTMYFTTAEPSVVRLSVYDVLGNEVVALCNQMLEAGEHSYSWDGSNSPQGMYHAILKINNTIKETSLVIVR